MPRWPSGDAPDAPETVYVRRTWPDDATGPWLIEMAFGLLDERVQCTGVRLSHQDMSEAVTQDFVRRLPLARLIDDVRKDPPPELTRLVLPGPFYRVGDMAEYGLGLLAPPTFPSKLDDTFLDRVAAVYRASPSKPTTAVAEHFGVPQPRAANWVRRARGKGFLPPVRRGDQNRKGG